ncbi:hypothetical protein DYB26_001042 [Aphanomyces astaci]|uniref:1-alkyl-2-acetylglycerophosphocholine esterase n=1 Tax=Aphanomyces astaci TaxID=112090 RepID=A0A397D9K7_APHAT|nr:hypothetical protein DYB38_000863 [Aphanomyces astaci]RHY82822.1 hypothetical protein DYB26_001042 [Aphanomyces astaci]
MYYQRPPQSALDDWAGEGYFVRNNQVHTRVHHIQTVLDALADLQNDDVDGLLYHQLDLDRIVAAGHSFGGATVLSAAKRDARIKAVVGLDMWMEPLDADVVADGVPAVPVCSIISQHWLSEWDSHFELLKTMARRCRHPSSAFFALAQTRHNNFCDLPLFSPRRHVTTVQLGLWFLHDVWWTECTLSQPDDGGFERQVRELTQDVLDAGDHYKASASTELELVRAQCTVAFHDMNIAKGMNQDLKTQVEVVEERLREYDTSAASDDMYEKKLQQLHDLQHQAKDTSDTIHRMRVSLCC